jgi:hypothetical protein
VHRFTAHIALIFCSALIAGTALGDGPCAGAILRTTSRFLGTIRSVKPLAEGAEVPNRADFDPLFEVVIDVVDVAPGVPAPKSGDRLRFGIHSPSRTFGSGKLLGHSFDLQTERMECDGKFWEFIALQRHWLSPMVETFNGPLEVGHTYRVKTKWNGKNLEWNKSMGSMDLPMHHDGEIDLMNAEEFLTNPEQVHEIVFEVVALHITMTGERSWLSRYEIKIISTR